MVVFFKNESLVNCVVEVGRVSNEEEKIIGIMLELLICNN